MISLLLATLLSYAASVSAQAGCMQLTGSTTCSGFQDQYINPSNLQQEWPFFAQVNDVASFDAQLSNYLATSDSNGFRAEKYVQQLGCSNVTSTYVLQYSQTFLCSMFTQISFTAGCYQRTNVVRRMACQSTCLQFATSENYLVQDSLSCGATNLVGDYRTGNMTADFTSCTEWTTLATNNTDTCVLGQVNEGNCGFRDSRTQLCNYCNPDGNVKVDSCCGSLNTNLAGCGYNLAAADIASTPVGTQAVLPLATNSASPSAGADNQNMGTSRSGGSGLSKGAIAGIVIGSVIGAIKIALLIWVCCFRRKKSGNTISQEYGLFGSSRKDSEDDKSTQFLNEKQNGGLASSPTSSGSPNLKDKNSPSGSGSLDGAAALGPAGARLRGRLSLDSSAYTGSSAEARNLVSSYRDHYSTVNIVPGSNVTAIYAYNPNLPDELRLEPENIVRINKIFDDGWASGQVIGSTAPEGFFPLVVVTASLPSDRAYDASSSHGDSAQGSDRTSSLSRANSFNSAASRLISGQQSEVDGQSLHDPMRRNPTVKRKPVIRNLPEAIQ